MARRGVPKRDGSGGGVRANRRRGGCTTTRRVGRGSNTRSGRGRPGRAGRRYRNR